jgi:hypothetical protein
MPIDTGLVRSVLDQSLERFLATEIDALLQDVSERSNCGRLAIYLEGIAHASGLTGYYADTEYNRMQKLRQSLINNSRSLPSTAI